MKVSSRGELTASAYADRRLELDESLPALIRAAQEAAADKCRDAYQTSVARLLARVPEQSKERAEKLYLAVAKTQPVAEPEATAYAEAVDEPEQDGMCIINGCNAAAFPGETMCAIHDDKFGGEEKLSPALLQPIPPLNAIVKDRAR